MKKLIFCFLGVFLTACSPRDLLQLANTDAGIESAINSYSMAQDTLEDTRIVEVIHIEDTRGQRQAIAASEPTSDGNQQKFYLLVAESGGWKVREHYWLFNGRAITPNAGLSHDLSPEQFVKVWREVRDHPEVLSRKLRMHTVLPTQMEPTKETGGEAVYRAFMTDSTGQLDFCVRVGINPEGKAYVKSFNRAVR